MDRRLPLGGWIIAGLLSGLSPAMAQTAELEIKSLSSSPEYGSKEHYLSMTAPQHFSWHRGMPEDAQEPRFDSVIKKEPKYTCEHPFRGVVKIGSYQYGFACDASKLKSKGYDRLYLDRNRDGDLTDEQPIRAVVPPGIFNTGSYHHYDLPRQTLQAEAGGKTFEGPFEFTLGTNMEGDGTVNYAYLSVKNASYRQGKITVDGKEHLVVLLDYNSNGTFNDLFAVDENIRMAGGELYPTQGDMVLIDPDARTPRYVGYTPSNSPDRQYLSKLVSINGHYHEISTTPSGDKITLKPAGLPLGAVKNTNGPYRAVLYGDKGLIKISGEKDAAVAVPAGQWRLLEYQINLTDAPAAKANSKPAPTEQPTPEKKKSLGRRIASLLGADTDSSASPVNLFGRPTLTLVGARATSKGKPITVAAGKTETLPFGPPYRPVVSVSYLSPDHKEARLELKLIGTADEVCESMMIKGQSPPQPSFRILSKDSELITKGQFEYG